MSRPLQPQHSLDFDDVFDDDITLLANGNCRFIYANATESCKSCSLIGQTCSPIHVQQTNTCTSSTSGQIQNGGQQIQNGAQQQQNGEQQVQTGVQQMQNGANHNQNSNSSKLRG